MKIKVPGLPMAYSDTTPQSAARRIAERFGLIVEISAGEGPGGWPEVSVIGTPKQIMEAITDEGGWSSGDDEQDAELVYLAMRDAVEVYG